MMNESKYEKMCDKLNAAQMYDGRGTYDRYECKKCHAEIYTTYVDKGVTPFMLCCRECGDVMTHVRTYSVPPKDVPVYGWRRPTYKQFCKLSDSMKEHVIQGGLELDKKPMT